MKTVSYLAQSLKTYASEKSATTFGKKHRQDAFLQAAQLPCGRWVYQFTMTVRIGDDVNLISGAV